MKGSALRDGTTQDRGVQFFGPGVVNGCTVEYCYIHDQDNCPFLCRNVCNFLLQQNFIARNHYTDDQHSEGLSISGTCTNVTVRLNQWIDCEGTALICTPGGTGHPGCSGPSICNWYIYGNVCAYTSWGIANSRGFGDGIVYLFDTQAHGDMMIYNNTVANINHSWNGAIWCDNSGDSPACADHFYVENNLFWNNTSTVSPSSGNVSDFKWDHNAYFSQAYSDSDANKQVTTGNPFVSTNSDWRLSGPFNIDMDGQVRGADGVWDRGAYEYENGTVITKKVTAGLTNLITLEFTTNLSSPTTWQTIGAFTGSTNLSFVNMPDVFIRGLCSNLTNFSLTIGNP